ncbi:hypothetical protein ACJ6WE_20945 [Streptomyces sp. MMS24-I31]|uniref:hypothetical protein n=1 Tax=Streptomyces sp. MMS24-I31 TaxID=3351563 RepID=UPI0038968FAB
MSFKKLAPLPPKPRAKQLPPAAEAEAAEEAPAQAAAQADPRSALLTPPDLGRQ